MGESVPGELFASLGDVIRDEVETVELGLGGAKCGEGEACKSGVPFAWKNLGCDLSSPMSDPTADLLEL